MYVGDKFGRIWLWPTSCLVTCGSKKYPFAVQETLTTTVNSIGAVDVPNGSTLNCRTDPGGENACTSWTVNRYVEVYVLETNGYNPLPCL